MLDRFTPSTSFELSDYRKWLRERPRFARHGTPIWSTVPTEPAPSLTSQINALAGGKPVSVLAGTEQSRLVAYTATWGGGAGADVRFARAVDGQDSDTRSRTSQLQLLNYELELIEPWIAGGTLTTSVTSTDREIQAAVLQTGGVTWCSPSGRKRRIRSRSHHGHGRDFVRRTWRSRDDERVRSLARRHVFAASHRVTGGMSVSIDDFGITSLILLAQDMLGEHHARTAAAGDRAAADSRDDAHQIANR